MGGVEGGGFLRYVAVNRLNQPHVPARHVEVPCLRLDTGVIERHPLQVFPGGNLLVVAIYILDRLCHRV